MSDLPVLGFKLNNGLELIGKLAGETDKSYRIEDAFFLQTVKLQDGSFNIEYVPLTILGKPTGKTHLAFDIDLPLSSVLFPYEINPGIADRYAQLLSPIDLSMAPSVK